MEEHLGSTRYVPEQDAVLGALAEKEKIALIFHTFIVIYMVLFSMEANDLLLCLTDCLPSYLLVS